MSDPSRIEGALCGKCVCGKPGKRGCPGCGWRMYCSKECLNGDKALHETEHTSSSTASPLASSSPSSPPSNQSKEIQPRAKSSSSKMMGEVAEVLVGRMIEKVEGWSPNITGMIGAEMERGRRLCSTNDDAQIGLLVSQLLVDKFDAAMEKAMIDVFGEKRRRL